MPLCGSAGCNCAFTSETLTISVVDGVVSLEQAEFTSITELENDVASLYAALDLLPATYVDLTGDNMTGALGITAANQSLSVRRSTDAPYIEFRSNDGTTRYGILQYDSTVGAQLITDGALPVKFGTNGTERGRFDTSGRLLIGKSTSDSTTVGMELSPVGVLTGTRTDGTATILNCNKAGAGVASGTIYANWLLSGTSIGTVTRNAATSAVLYNTTSDEDTKTNIMPLGEELAEWLARIIEPVLFNRIDSLDVTQVGYIAQRVAALWPEAIECGFVTPGCGDVANRHWDDDGNELTTPDEWTPWMMDYSTFVPILHGAWRSTARKLDDLTERVSALEQPKR